MSYDFAVIPVDSFSSPEEAARICALLYDEPPGSPPPALADLIEQLERDDAIGDDGFLSVWPVDAYSHGVVLCTRPSKNATFTVLELTKNRGLAVIDVQTGRLYDPRDRIEVQVTIGGGTDLPYLTQHILDDVVARPSPSEPWVVVARGDHNYIQAYLPPDSECVLEYRAGSPDRHYRVTTNDRSVVAQAVWGWTERGPEAVDHLEWTRVDPAEFEG